MTISNNNRKNNFIRLFPSHISDSTRILNLDNEGYYIAGIAQEKIYLGNSLFPLSLSIIDMNLNDIKHYSINIPPIAKKEYSLFHLSIDSLHLYINNFVTGTILWGLLSEPSIELKILDTPNYSTSIFFPISEKTFAIRSYDPFLRKNVLGMISIDPLVKRSWPQLLEQQNEGVFSTDGMFRYDMYTSSFVYIYFYRNQFIHLNNKFQILYKEHTLDTNTVAKIKVATIESMDESTISSPDYFVSRQACIDKKWIAINSGLKADNEDEKTFRDFSVVDMYGLIDGHYHFSFYVPKLFGKITSMFLYENILYTIQGHDLYRNYLNLNAIKL